MLIKITEAKTVNKKDFDYWKEWDILKICLFNGKVWSLLSAKTFYKDDKPKLKAYYLNKKWIIKQNICKNTK